VRERLSEGEKRRKGEGENLNKARITRVEMLEAVREHGVSEIREVDLAILETDGNISIISNEYKNRTTKKRKGRNKVMKNQ